jgi:glucokinase
MLSIALDVGGTKIAAGLVDAVGRLRTRRSLPTRPERGGAAVLAECQGLVRELAAEAGGAPIGVGVSLCELVDPVGEVASGYTVDWRGLAPAQALGLRGRPALLSADVRANALAEAQLGAGRPFESFILISIGTGISSCWVQAGRVHAGAHGNALVLSTGALTVPDAAGHLHPFVLETYASGPALVERYRAATGQALERAEAVLSRAEQGDAHAHEVVTSAATVLGSAIAWLVNVLDPHAVVLAGGLGAAPGLYRDGLVPAIRAHIWADASRDLPLLPAALGPDGALIGAGLLGKGTGWQ